jgi:hypothetical protein
MKNLLYFASKGNCRDKSIRYSTKRSNPRRFQLSTAHKIFIKIPSKGEFPKIFHAYQLWSSTTPPPDLGANGCGECSRYGPTA